MLFARRIHLSRWFPCALLLALLLCLAGTVCAEDQYAFEITVTPSSLAAPGDVTVSVRVSNPSDTPMTDTVALYDDQNNPVTGFGDGGVTILGANDSETWQGTVSVTQDQLDAGKLTYTILYNTVDASNVVSVVSQTAVAQLTYTGVHPELTVTRNISPEVVRSGGTVTVLYTLQNTGNVGLTGIRVRENSSISGTSQTVSSLDVGESATVKFTATVTKQLTSKATVTYKAKGATDSYTADVEQAIIAVAAPNLSWTLAAEDTSIDIGGVAKLTLTLINTGNVTYSNITVTDATFGEVFTNLSVQPGETLVKTKEYTLTAPASFQYTLTLEDNTGTTQTVKTEKVNVSAYNPEQALYITLVLTSETPFIASEPADVRFTVVVTNNSNVTAADVELYHGSTLIYTIKSLAPNEQVTVTRDYTISQAGKFRFTAKAKDSLSNEVSFDSNEITVAHAAPTAVPSLVPSVSVAPLVLVTAAPIEILEPGLTAGSTVLHYAVIVLGGFAGVAFLLFAVASVARAKRLRESKHAYDHLVLSDRRDYTEPASVREEPGEETQPLDESKEEPAPAVTPAPIMNREELPSQRILRESSAEKPASANEGGPAGSENAKETAETSAPIPEGGEIPLPSEDDTDTYRLTREDSEKPEEAEAPRRRRASSRKNGRKPSEDE